MTSDTVSTPEAASNPHAGRPFTAADADDTAIAAALEDVSVPALLCSMVHLTGDPAWIRGELRPRVAMLNDFQGGMDPADQAEARRLALPGHRRLPGRRLRAAARRRRRNSSTR